MRSSTILGCLAALTLLAPTSAPADDVTGVDRMICSAVEATVCSLEGDCEVGAPWSWDIPQFIVVDLADERLATTEASGENRSTPIKNIERNDGAIFLQGVENGRAFSFVINEQTGTVSVAVARDGLTVAVFGACTPMPR